MGINYDCENAPDRTLSLPSIKQGAVFITARSLFLNEKVSTFFRRGFDFELAWNRGGYAENLKLDDKTLRSWSGKKLLDIGAGASLFAEEVGGAYDIGVTNLDLNIGRSVDVFDEKMPTMSTEQQQLLGLKPSDTSLTRKGFVRRVYARNLEWLWCNKQNEINRDPELLAAFEKIFNRRYSIAESFYNDPNTRIQGDATAKDRFSKGAFDRVISVWVLNYLNRDLKKKMLQNMIYWTKTPGEIRICGGQNRAEGSSQDADLTPTTFKALFADVASGGWVREWHLIYEGRRVTVDPRSDNNCLILKCIDESQGAWFDWL